MLLIPINTRMRVYSLVACLSVWLLLNTSVLAQGRKIGYFSLGPSVGFCHYQGDLDDNGFDFWNIFAPEANNNVGNPTKLLRPGLGFSAYYTFHPLFSIRGQFNQGWIGASDRQNTVFARQQRNLSFRSPVTELSLQLVMEFFKSPEAMRHYKFRVRFTPYAFAGISLFSFNPQAQADPAWLTDPLSSSYFDSDPNKWYSLQPLGTEGQNSVNTNKTPYALTQVSIPLGLGLRMSLNDRLDLRADIGLRRTFTDHLDDVSGKFYADPQQFIASGNIQGLFFSDRSSSKAYGDPRTVFDNRTSGYKFNDFRGNDQLLDWYAFSTISLTYIISKADRCPRFKNGGYDLINTSTPRTSHKGRR
jgi:hypothetical protein